MERGRVNAARETRDCRAVDGTDGYCAEGHPF